MPNAAAFFDLDRTLIAGASAFPLGIEAWRQDLASAKDLLGWAIMAVMFKVIGDTGEGTSTEVMSDFLSRIEGTPTSELDLVGSSLLPRLVDRVRPESRKLLSLHHEHGRDTWIVSASPEELVEPLAGSLGMTGAIGTRGEVVDGRYTGLLDGPFVYGPGKAEAISKLAVERGYDLERCYAYSDSVSDLPMLELVGHPVAVNPDSRLDAIAHDRGWPVVIFARKTKRAIAFGGVGAGTLLSALAAYLLGRRHGREANRARLSLRRG
ncbi:MAG: HAD family hydrolase [Acidimicrobiia bacterium]